MSLGTQTIFYLLAETSIGYFFELYYFIHKFSERGRLPIICIPQFIEIYYCCVPQLIINNSVSIFLPQV